MRSYEDLPEYWRQKVRDLRRENAKLRIERNEARKALEALGQQLNEGTTP